MRCLIASGVVALLSLWGATSLIADSLLRTPFQDGSSRFDELRLQLDKSRASLEVEILNKRPSNINWKSVPTLKRELIVDLENLDASEALDQLFSEESIQKWFMTEQWLSLYQCFLSQMDFGELIHLSDLLDYMEIWPEADDDFYIQYFRCKDLIGDLDANTKRKVLMRSYQSIADRLREMSHDRRRWGVEVSQFFHQDSNVHQMPSGEPLVSTTSGISSQSEVSLNYTSKDYSFGQTQFEVGVLGVNYLKSGLEERNFQTYRLGMDHQFLLSGPFALGGFSLDIRSDILNLNNIKEESSRSILPSFNLISRPKKFKKGSFLDSIVSAGIFYYEQRSALGQQAADQSGRTRDVEAMHFNYVAIAQKRHALGMIYSTFSLGYRQQSSTALDLQYDVYQLGWGIQLSNEENNLSLNTRLSERKQDNYQTFPRNDRTLDIDVTYDRALPWRGCTAQTSYAFTHQRSNLNLTPFDNHHFSLGLTWNY